MTLHRFPSASGLLSRKGAASPLGLRKGVTDESSAEAVGGRAEPRAEASEPVQLALVSATDAGDLAGLAGEPPPPASLLPFSLHRARSNDDEAWELVSPHLLTQVAEAANPADQRAARAESHTAVEPVLPAPFGTPKIRPSQLTIRIPEAAAILVDPSAPASVEKTGDAGDGGPSEARPTPEAAGALSSTLAAQGSETPEARPETPVAEPSWRVGAETPTRPRHAVPARWLVLGAAAGLLIGGIAWWSFESQAPEPSGTPGTAESAAKDAAVTPAETAGRMADEAETLPGAAQDPAAIEAPEAELGSGAPVAAPPEAAPPEMTPSVDLVRIEANGEAVIAGRAAPHSDLIILDNGSPIGTVRADAFGEWVFVPDRPLPAGGHEFGLVLKSVQGTVSVPEEPQPPRPAPAAGETQTAPEDPTPAAPGDNGAAAPALEETGSLAPVPPRKPFASPRESDLGAPIPERKPDPGIGSTSDSSAPGAPNADFVVQLASVKTRAGAQREWQKLQSRFPEVLAGMSLKLHEIKLSQRGTVIRVRTGPFSGHSEAADFCARIRTARQDCLVVRTAAGD